MRLSFYLLVLLNLLIAFPGLGLDLATELLSLSNTYEKNFLLEPNQSRENDLLVYEESLFNSVLTSQDGLPGLSEVATRLETGLLNRLINRIQFKVVQESRNDLNGTLDSLRKAFSSRSEGIKGKKKIANIGGREVDLLDGEWNTAPDGKRFWVSNEYPEIVLTPAEYRRYLATAVVVDE
ncbi:hypothetical protein HYY75_04935 [bacterium]|nr:hypothetical protein [bacterium]